MFGHLEYTKLDTLFTNGVGTIRYLLASILLLRPHRKINIKWIKRLVVKKTKIKTLKIRGDNEDNVYFHGKTGLPQAELQIQNS